MTPTSTPDLSDKTAVLLINLGTPDAPTASALRPFLKEFLGDPRVVEIPRLAWWPILHGIILNTRPKQSAEKYRSIWTPEGSPLKVHTERQTALVREQLASFAPGVRVEYAMRYGNPSIPNVLQTLHAEGYRRIVLLPLYPQYAASTVATSCDVAFAEMRKMRNAPAVRTVRHFQDHPGYIGAVAQSVKDYWSEHGRPEKLVMSFHGLPKFTVDKGDPYYYECLQSGRLIAQQLELDESQYQITFQSRFGRAEWLQPYTAPTLAELGKQKLRRVDVICPGFVADCLETLEEIALEVRDEFLHAGGGEYHYIPCLNERPDWIRALARIALENLNGWVDAPAR